MRQSLGQRMQEGEGARSFGRVLLGLDCHSRRTSSAPSPRVEKLPAQAGFDRRLRLTRYPKISHPRTPTSYRDPGPGFVTFTSSQGRRLDAVSIQKQESPINVPSSQLSTGGRESARRIAPGLRLRRTLETLNPNRSAGWRIWPRRGRVFTAPDSRGTCDIEGSDSRRRHTAAR